MTRAWFIWGWALCASSTATDLPKLPPIPATQPFTFVVLGDNRGDDSGQQPPAFFQIVEAVDRDAPSLVLDTGDMIYGRTTEDARAREQWRLYQAAAGRVRAPMFHVPGNHDLWDEASGRLYRELWGPTYYAFEFGNTRFIGLDTETIAGRLGEEQLRWLEKEFEGLSAQNVFVFCHRPLFPVGAGIGSSLDAYPVERDRIHRLFARHRDVVRGVFAGHEHLFSFQEHDGVPYYITGGGGAPLYAAPELGGFHHYLTVRVSGTRAEVDLRKVGASRRDLQKPKTIAVRTELESWQQGLLWYAWDRTAMIELTPERATDGRRALRLNFDPAEYAWPVLVFAPAEPLDLRATRSLSLDAFLPDTLRRPVSLTTVLQGSSKHEAAPVTLHPGWNTITTELDATWLPTPERAAVQSVEWSLTCPETNAPGYVLFDSFRALTQTGSSGGKGTTLETWERPLLWRVFDETVRADFVPGTKTRQRRGLVLHLDFAKCNRPVIFAQLNPPWDLSRVKTLELRVGSTGPLPPDATIALSCRAKDIAYTSARKALGQGSRRIDFELAEAWLPTAARLAAEQIEFTLVTTNTQLKTEIAFESLSSGKESAP